MAKPTDSTERTSLYLKSGSSDKEYHASIEPQDSGFTVNFAYGRRGSTLQTGTKTPTPVDYATAKKAFDKLVNEKLAKGYTPGTSGTPYQHTDRQDRATGVFPQLLNAIDESEVEKLINDDRWWMQEKIDGRRVLLRKLGREIVGINRSSLIIDLPRSIIEAAANMEIETCLMDGECVGEIYQAFDLLEREKMDLRPMPYTMRHAELMKLVEGAPTDAVRSVVYARQAAEKRAMLVALKEKKAEGVVFKRMDAAYTPGRPASGGDQLKHKFYATASCIVAKINGTKRSVALMLLDGERHVSVGNVTIPPNREIPKKGEVVEVRYLYAYEGGSLYQPVYFGKRDDLDAAECRLAQLKHKPIDDDES